ncbi:MAG: type II toxin-antitoxin system Phd/YefM family antitoxin [Hyphomicrobiales bacterium]|nr:type II toxin-antitoxin system Phd/YefM family antitoxin [Hyphomicrobiales bacterium]MBV9754905.1 type II toxin-antitoxin system Phd/YefM family antitoxin [Hyphomicrobiales bacterium]
MRSRPTVCSPTSGVGRHAGREKRGSSLGTASGKKVSGSSTWLCSCILVERHCREIDPASEPISYLREHAPEMIRGLAEEQDPFVITVHGEAKAVLLDVQRYEEKEETLALPNRELADVR